MKNEKLYLILFNLREMINIVMPFDDCHSLQYATKLCMIDYICYYMDQLFEDENLSSIPVLFEPFETTKKKPELKEFLNVKNQVFIISKFLETLNNTDLLVVSDTFDQINDQIKEWYEKKV